MPYLAFVKRPENDGFVKVFNNRRVLSEFIGVSYNTLTNHFVRNKEVWHYYDEEDVTIIRFDNVEKGRQRIKRYDPQRHNRNI